MTQPSRSARPVQGRTHDNARSIRRSSSALVLAALALATPSARANGRFPYAQQLREVVGELVVSGTYGLLLSGNGGRDFQFVCESSLFGKTLMGSWLDPLLEVLPDGTLVSGSRSGLRVSRDRGCTFQNDWSLPFDPTFIPPAAGASGGNGSVIDVCPAYSAPDSVLALATVYAADNSTLEHRIYRSSDDARSWAQLGNPIPTSLVRVVLTLDAAPSRPQRIYVSGSSMQGEQLLVSDDAGVSWEAHTIPVGASAGVGGVYIGAVSPIDPDRVYLRVNRQSETDDGSLAWDDSLLVSEDGGKTIREVLRKQASLLGFALSPDGNTVAAGYGDPVVAPIIVADADLGLYGASASDLTFTQRVDTLAVSCLRWTANGLYACAKESDPLGVDTSGTPDFHVGVYEGSGLPQKLADFTPLLKLKDVRGPMPWIDNRPSGCLSEWSARDPANPSTASVCESFNACASGGTTTLSARAIECGPAPDGGAGAASTATGGVTSNGGVSATGGVSGAGGATANGGSTGASANVGGSSGAAASAGAAGATSPGVRDSGCGFRMRPQNGHDIVIWCALGASLLGVARRRRTV